VWKATHDRVDAELGVHDLERLKGDLRALA